VIQSVNSRFVCLGLHILVFSNKLDVVLHKVKVKLSLCLINYATCHKDVGESGGTAAPSFTSGLHGGKWSASRSGRFTPGDGAPGAHWIRG
jgi:hypothetical protein